LLRSVCAVGLAAAVYQKLTISFRTSWTAPSPWSGLRLWNR